MKKLIPLLMVISPPVTAYEQVRTSDGVTCRSERDTRTEMTTKAYTSDSGAMGASVSITIKIGSMAEKLDCSKFANLELERLKLELELLKAQLKDQNTWE
jgi:hypothetical protein